MISPQTVLIGLGSGLASAVLFYSAARGGVVLTLILFILTPLPVLIAGLGWSWVAAFAASIAGSLMMAIAGGPDLAFGYLIAVGLPTMLVAWLVDLGRQRPDSSTEWYPPAKILAAIVGYAGAVPLLIAPLFGGSYETLKPRFIPFVRTLLERVRQQTNGPPITDASVDQWAGMMVTAMPSTITAYWLLLFVINVYLAARVAKASGHMLRERPDLHRLQLPSWAPMVLAAAIVLMALDGVPRIIGSTMTAAFVVGYSLIGLSVLHAIAKGRLPWMLWLAYIGLLNPVGIYVLALLAMIGLADPLLRLRDRFVKHPAPPAPPAQPPTI